MRRLAITATLAAALPIFCFAPAAHAGSKAPKVEAPIPAEVGKPAPDFTLTDTDGKEHTLSDYTKKGKTVVLEWFNPDCPFVKKHHVTYTTMIDTEAKFRDAGVTWLAINSGGPGKQGYGLERNRKARQEYEMPYPVLIDEDGKVGHIYGAKTTPHMFVISPEGVLVYAGAIDDAPNPQDLGATNYVQAALTQCLAGEEVEKASTKSYGCSVKYTEAGNM